MKKTLFIFLIFCTSVTWAAHGDTSKVATQSAAPLAKTTSSGDLQLRFKPKFGLGIGNLTFFGDISDNHKGSHLTVSRLASELRVTHPITSYLDFQFHTMFGRISANERSLTNLSRNLNFESRIRAGGIGLSYNFNHILVPKEKRVVEPFIYLGFESFEFLSKTDLYDADGNAYNYWSDGSIRNLAEDDINADLAIKVQRDYIYETDLREQNIDGEGAYPERSFAVPFGIGVNLIISEYFQMRVGGTMHFALTDLVDNVTSNSVGDRQGNAQNDKFFFTNVTLTYNLKPFKSVKEELEELKNPWEEPLYASDTFDYDNDGVVDFQDMCVKSPNGCRPIKPNGCGEDLDADGVPDCRDDELDSPGPYVDDRGVTITDEMIELAFRQYKDSTGEFSSIEVTTKKTIIGESIVGAKAGGSFNADDLKGKEYFIVLDKKQVNVKANDLYDYLQWKRFKTITQGDSVFYVLDGLNLDEAVALDEKLKTDGVDTKSISKRELTDEGDVKVVDASQGDIDVAKSNNGPVPTITASDEITYRVQIAAYNTVQKPSKFVGIPDLVEFQGNDNVYRYYSGIYENINDASLHKVIMTSEKGFPDAFVVAFKDGQRISLKEVTEVNPDYDEGIEAYQNAVQGDGAEFFYTVQVGAYKELPKDLFDLFLTLDDKLDSKEGDDGIIKYTIGNYKTESAARAAMENLRNKGVSDAFVIINKGGDLIELKDAGDLIKD